jgi:hypothetical protein
MVKKRCITGGKILRYLCEPLSVDRKTKERLLAKFARAVRSYITVEASFVDSIEDAAGEFRTKGYTPYPGTELDHVALQHGLKEPEKLEGWANFNYRRLAQDAPWVPPETRKLVEGLDFPLMFLGKGHFVVPYKKTNPLVVALGKLYHPIARYRIKHLDVRFPIETKTVKALGFFGRQD